VLSLTPLMLTKKNRHLARLYLKYFFTRVQVRLCFYGEFHANRSPPHLTFFVVATTSRRRRRAWWCGSVCPSSRPSSSPPPSSAWARRRPTSRSRTAACPARPETPSCGSPWASPPRGSSSSSAGRTSASADTGCGCRWPSVSLRCAFVLVSGQTASYYVFV
jgi:hypothetical protein